MYAKGPGEKANGEGKSKKTAYCDRIHLRLCSHCDRRDRWHDCLHDDQSAPAG